MSTNTQHHYRSSVLNQLNDEWRRLCRSSQHVTTAREWRVSADPVSSLEEVLTLAGFRGSRVDDDADRVLLQLVQRAATDQLAARVVLQRVLPPLVSVARRRGKVTQGGFEEALATLLAHAWEVIRTYPVERRPAKVASNIVRDAEYFGFVRRSRQVAELQTFDPDSFASAPQYYNSSEHLDDLLERARRSRVSAQSIEVLRELGTSSLAEMAEHHGLSLRAARRRRQQAINELRVRTLSAA
ncbi:MAG: hypothetical protein EBT17_04930 [Actinobacteria bacterium]|nr:hypothetical protein [Actinomycetota bacterium]NDG77162.1 hypothetical protein [Acidimicrobiia bacterium]NBP17704.1 hypothetical protein [Actinomycetota bacterium]NBT21443.1 hypothetical protein [Actinomycetota bacterium]NBY57556.1 hypothetical protein [Actinomycetota bacterium]